MAGFWKAPRELARMLSARELTPSEYTLLNFVCQSGADRPGGFMTTNVLLASVLDVNEKTVRRGLRSLRARDLIVFDDHERVAHFTIRSADTLRTLEGVSMSAPMSAELRTSTPADIPANPADKRETDVSVCGHGFGPETETETENPPKPPQGGAGEELNEAIRPRRRRDRRSNTQVINDVAARLDAADQEQRR